MLYITYIKFCSITAGFYTYNPPFLMGTDRIPYYSIYKYCFFFPRKITPSTVEISRQIVTYSTPFLEE